MRVSLKKKTIVKMFMVGCVVLGGTFLIGNNKTHQKSISEKILRFHVIANSDSEADQNVKLKVRDGVLEYLSPYFENCEDKASCIEVINERKAEIKIKAEEILNEEGFYENVEVEMSNKYFPVKNYGSFTFPEGEYEALCVKIGEASGKNWWCVLYPRLCFLDSVYAVVPGESKEELKCILTEEEYDSIYTDTDKKIVVKSKALEWIKNIM